MSQHSTLVLILRTALIALIVLCMAWGCKTQTTTELEALPELNYTNVDVPNFVPRPQWDGRRVDWDQVAKSLRLDLQAPVALETKLHKDDRTHWKQALDSYEQYLAIQKDARIMAKFAFIPLDECKFSSALFSLNQRAQLQILLQQHRNVLWHLGRLALAHRYLQKSLAQLQQLFINDRIKGADLRVNKSLKAIIEALDDIQKPFPTPNGIWRQGDLHPRIARLANASPIVLRAKFALLDWTEHCAESTRWNYLAPSSQQSLDALDKWLQEFQDLSAAFKDYSIQAANVEQAFEQKSILESPCLNQSLRRNRILSSLYTKLASMQWELLGAQVIAEHTKQSLLSHRYDDSTPQYLQSEVQNFIDTIQNQKIRLTQAQDLLLVIWDQSNHALWQSLPEFIDPITYPTRPACEDAKAWQAIFSQVQQNILSLAVNTAPETISPKELKTKTTYISTIHEFLLSPTRIDEVEKGLLAISELESHMSSIRDELLRLCKDGACKSFPEAQLHRNLKNAPWVRLWQQSPVQDRQPALSFLVLKRANLYLNRLVQRFTEIYAWFAETSNADITWPKLNAWQRTWTLYAELDGSYASFLRSIASLDQSLYSFTRAPANRAPSEHLLQLLQAQYELFNIVIDYARFSDLSAAPGNFEDVIQTWSQIDKTIGEIEAKTLAQIPPEP